MVECDSNGRVMTGRRRGKSGVWNTLNRIIVYQKWKGVPLAQMSEGESGRGVGETYERL